MTYQPLLLSSRLRHIVFPDEARRRSPVVNVAACGEPAPEAGPAGPDLSHEAATLTHWLFAQAGLDARQYRTETLRRRLPACLRLLRARSPAHARQVLEQKPGLAAAALSSLLVGVTSFFRDPPVFDTLERQLLPELARGRAGLYLWSAGCSDGAELYSLALLLADASLLGQSYLLGTDCRADALARAREGCFDAAAVRAVPPHLLGRYFTPWAGGWQAVPALRGALRWRTADVLKTLEPGAWDVILFRNTAMYLRAEAANPLWARLETALRPGGLLVLGKAERPTGAGRLSPVGPCIYRRNRG
jgi:chemotaxis methyl-accepting protein methylase